MSGLLFRFCVWVWSRLVLLALLCCLVSSSGSVSKRGNDPGHRPKDRVFRPTDHVKSGLSVVAGSEGRRPEDRSFGRYPFLRTSLQWYWWWLLGTYFGLYPGLFFLRLLLFRSSVQPTSGGWWKNLHVWSGLSVEFAFLPPTVSPESDARAQEFPVETGVGYFFRM